MKPNGLCIDPQDEHQTVSKQPNTYVFFKSTKGDCIHLHTSCYQMYVLNERYLDRIWNTGTISFANRSLYHEQEIKGATINNLLKCCECSREAYEMDWKSTMGITSRYYLYYGSVSVNKHILCENCFDNDSLNEVSKVTTCQFCNTAANPFVVLHRDKQLVPPTTTKSITTTTSASTVNNDDALPKI